MNRTRIILLCSTLLLFVMAGCRSHRHITTEPVTNTEQPTTERDKTPKLDSILNASFSSYCANYSCTVEGIEVNGQIRIIHDSCIWISVNKIIEVGRVILTPTRVSGYAKLFGKYFDGSYEDVKKRWGVDIDYSILEAMLVGNRPPNCTLTRNPERNGDLVTLNLTQKGKSQRKITIHKSFSTLMATTTLVGSASSASQVRCAYADRKAIAGQMLPTAVETNVTYKGTSKQTRLNLSNIKLNQQLSTPFKMPKNLEKL